MAVIQTSFVNEYKLLEVRDIFCSGKDQEGLSQLSSIEPKVQKRVYHFARKVLGKHEATKSDALIFSNASLLQKKSIIDCYLLQFFKYQLKKNSKQFEIGESSAAFSSFVDIAMFSKKWEILSAFDDDIYSLTWEILGKPSVEDYTPQNLGELTFWDETNSSYGITFEKRSRCLKLYSKSLKPSCYIDGLPSSLDKKARDIFVKILRNQTHIEIKGNNLFRKKILNDIQAILSTEVGTSLLQQIIEMKVEKGIKIKPDLISENKIFEDLTKMTIISSEIGILEQSDPNRFFISMDENGIIHPIPYCSPVALAHEFLHTIWKSKNSQLCKKKSTNKKLYPHAEEQMVITGKHKNKNYPLSENSIREALHLPIRTGHLSFLKPKSIFGACEIGFIHYIQEFLDKGESVNAINESFEDKWSLLHIVAWTEYFSIFPDNFKKVVDLLISKGADLENLDALKNTPLHIAAKEVRPNQPESEIAYLYLLSKGANPKAKDALGKTPEEYFEFYKGGKFIQINPIQPSSTSS